MVTTVSLWYYLVVEGTAWRCSCTYFAASMLPYLDRLRPTRTVLQRFKVFANHSISQPLCSDWFAVVSWSGHSASNGSHHWSFQAASLWCSPLATSTVSALVISCIWVGFWYLCLSGPPFLLPGWYAGPWWTDSPYVETLGGLFHWSHCRLSLGFAIKDFSGGPATSTLAWVCNGKDSGLMWNQGYEFTVFSTSLRAICEASGCGTYCTPCRATPKSLLNLPFYSP